MPTQTLARTIRACKPCRNLKVRCLPSEQGEICQKCLRSGAECIFEEQKPRRKREQPDSRARVAALEKKLEEVLAHVSQNNSATVSLESSGNAGPNSVRSTSHFSHDQSPTQVGQINSKPVPNRSTSFTDLPTPESQTRDDFASHSSDGPSSFGGYSNPWTPTFARYLRGGATPDSLIAEDYLSIEEVEHYIEKFREMCVYFPFVMIPYRTSVQAMRRDRPLLLHAVLAVVTANEVHLQKELEKSFKEVMLKRLILEAEKSIDLLQSILVCMAWGHFFHVPKRDQSYQLLQMAVGLCVDLGLNTTPSSAKQRFGLRLDHSHYSDSIKDEDLWSREARRAYLGCYHVSTMNNWIWAKPNTLECSDYILECARSISAFPEYPTDELVLPLIQLQQTGDEYHKVLRVDRNEAYSHDLIDRISTHARSFHSQIHNLQANLTPTAASSPTIQLATHFSGVHTLEQDLLSPFLSSSRQPASTAPPLCNPSRIDVLLSCLHSAKTYLDAFLTLPPQTYPHLSTTHWSGLIYSLVVIYRLSIGTPRIPTWDATTTRATVRLEKYLDALCGRVQLATRDRLKALAEGDVDDTIDGSPTTSKQNNNKHKKKPQRDLYSVIGLILHNVRNTYERLRRLPQALSQVDGGIVHATSFEAGEEQLLNIQEELGDGDASMPLPRPGPIFDRRQQQQEELVLPKAGWQSRCPAMQQFWSVPSEGMSGGDDGDGEMVDFDGSFLNLDTGKMMEDDGFWNQTFEMQQERWDLDLGLDAGVNMGLGMAGL